MNTPEKPVSAAELETARHNLSLLHNQLDGDEVDKAYFTRQVKKLDALLERLQHEHKNQQHGTHFEMLYNVSKALGSSLDLQTVLDQVMDAIIRLTNAERGFLMLRDDDGGLTVKAARNFDQQTLNREEFQFSRTIANHVVDTGSPVLTTNASEDPRFSSKRSIVMQALRSIMATPLRARGRVFGAAYVDSRAFAGLFEERDLTMMEAFSAQAAIALDNALLFGETDEALSKRVDELSQLRRIDLLLSATIDADEVMSQTLEWACRLSGACCGLLGMVETDRLVHTVHHHGDDGLGAPAILTERFLQVQDVIDTGQTIIDRMEDTNDCVLMIPMSREHQVQGVVVLVKHGDPFSNEQIDLLERVMARAAVSIANSRLYAAAQAANRAKSEFVGIVAHDLKAPMTSIKGYTELIMLKPDLTDQQIEYLTLISNTVDRMEKLVSDLADISRIESGHFFMEIDEYPVAWITQAVREGIMPEINARGHTYVEHIEEDLPSLWTDYYRLIQVLINLVGNACKYTPDGGTITLEAHRCPEGIVFSVSDTGIGLSREEVMKLGTKFWRSAHHHARSQSGSGLGFAISKSLIEQMGGRIHIESEPDNGSTFSFCLPNVPQEQA